MSLQMLPEASRKPINMCNAIQTSKSSIQSMAFMMSASVDRASRFGKPFAIVSIPCPLLP
jgi:hypothetical protein